MFFLYFLIKYYELLEKKKKKIWGKVSCSIKKGFDGESVYNEQYLKTKTKSYEGKINTNSHDERIPKESSHCICLFLILIDSVFKIGKNCYLQLMLEEFKYMVK